VSRAHRRFLRVATLAVEVVAGTNLGARAVSTGERLSVGTAAGNDLTLSDETVSRYHLELVREEHGVRVVDLESTNGTLVAGVRLERGLVQPGTVVEIGASKLRIDGNARATVELHDGDALGNLRGSTAAMRRMMASIKKVSATEVPILLVGESGTGKELIARAIHEHSGRHAGPLVTVDCGALSPGVVSSELFGHERGAFTGADRQRAGAFEHASGGTLFLDEIGELPPELQTYLLGALERKTVKRVGGHQDIPIDVRVVSATNRDLRAEVNAGNFRLDLYYRLAVACVNVPPLRDRIADIPLLVEHFAKQMGSSAPVDEIVPPKVMARLRTHRWPGNVRELRNLVEASVAMGEAIDLDTSSVPGDGGADATIDGLSSMRYRDARDAMLRKFERDYLTTIIDRAGGNVSKAAREAGMNRSHLSELLHRHKLR